MLLQNTCHSEWHRFCCSKNYANQIGTFFANAKSVPKSIGINFANAKIMPKRFGIVFALANSIPNLFGTNFAIAIFMPTILEQKMHMQNSCLLKCLCFAVKWFLRGFCFLLNAIYVGKKMPRKDRRFTCEDLQRILANNIYEDTCTIRKKQGLETELAIKFLDQLRQLLHEIPVIYILVTLLIQALENPKVTVDDILDALMQLKQ